MKKIDPITVNDLLRIYEAMVGQPARPSALSQFVECLKYEARYRPATEDEIESFDRYAYGEE